MYHQNGLKYGLILVLVCISLLDTCEAKIKKGKAEKEKKVRVVREVPVEIDLNERKPLKKQHQSLSPPVQQQQQPPNDNQIEEENLEEEYIIVPRQQYHRLQKPKVLTFSSPYEQCKQECKKQRDQETTKDYAERLRQELKVVEEHLNQSTTATSTTEDVSNVQQ